MILQGKGEGVGVSAFETEAEGCGQGEILGLLASQGGGQ